MRVGPIVCQRSLRPHQDFVPARQIPLLRRMLRSADRPEQLRRMRALVPRNGRGLWLRALLLKQQGKPSSCLLRFVSRRTTYEAVGIHSISVWA
jgi:hypothetical protein